MQASLFHKIKYQKAYRRGIEEITEPQKTTNSKDEILPCDNYFF
jgi:hypothetical protein